MSLFFDRTLSFKRYGVGLIEKTLKTVEYDEETSFGRKDRVSVTLRSGAVPDIPGVLHRGRTTSRDGVRERQGSTTDRCDRTSSFQSRSEY